MEGNYKKWINRINSKQDVLTEDNVGQFMDVKLSTKSTPTSGDTVLAMDSVTGKAVRIPTDQLGSNGGNIDLLTKLDKGGYEGTAQNLKNDIDNIQIGTVNLWRNSKLFLLSPNDTGLGTSVLYTDEADHYYRATPDAGKAISLFGFNTILENNTDYIHGLWVRNNGNTTVNLETYSLVGFPNGDVSRMLQPNVWTFIKSELIKGMGQASYFILICDTANVTIDYKKAILVKGNKLGNDWTPAPEDKQDRLQNITGNIGVGKTDASATEKLDVNGNVKATGFKTPTGTANKALTANGGVFDLNLKADKGLNIKITAPSNWVTGTVAETEVLRIEIPANSLSDNSFLNMPILYLSKIGTNGNMHIKGKLSTSPTMPSGTTDIIFGYTNIGATHLSFGMDRMFIVSNGLIKGFPFTVSAYSSSNVNTSSFSSKPFDRTVTNYLYISIQLANTADQARLEGIQLTNS